MIDLLTMNKAGLTQTDLLKIVEKNNLKTNSKDGVLYYDNEKKKFADGFYIRIETKTKRLKLECSLHKYFNYIITNKLTNFNLFSFGNAKNIIEILKSKTGINIEKMKVTYYEIGLNLYMEMDCKKYIDQMQTVGTLDNKRQFFVNPKYKGERIKTTVFHRHIKKVFKVYDKIHEMKDKQRNDIPTEHTNILRIETTQRRIENLTVSDLLKPKTIKRLTDQFLKDWRTVKFDGFKVIAKKGTHNERIELCKQMLLFDKEHILNQAKEELKKGSLTERQYRYRREFVVNEWDMFKQSIKIIPSIEETEFRNKLNDTLKIVIS